LQGNNELRKRVYLLAQLGGLYVVTPWLSQSQSSIKKFVAKAANGGGILIEV